MLLTVSIRRGWLVGLGLLALSPAVFIALPESLQTRFETIIHPDVGTEIERQSGEGRIQGFFTGLELWAANPMTGVGPGAWRPATGSVIESHNLFGQLVGETGTIGLAAFLLVLFAFYRNLKAMRRLRRDVPAMQDDFAFQVSKAVGVAVLLLLVMGCFGHNLFRFTWLWYGGFLIIARAAAQARVTEIAEMPETAEELPEGWTYHAGHGVTPQPAMV
jgi:O-antigen ligase